MGEEGYKDYLEKIILEKEKENKMGKVSNINENISTEDLIEKVNEMIGKINKLIDLYNIKV